MEDVKNALSWVYTMLETPKKERLAWVKRIFKGMLTNASSFVDKDTNEKNIKAQTKKIEKELEYLVRMVQEDCDIVGIAPNIQYIRVEGSSELLKPWWIHPFSSPTILAKHKTLPLMIIVGPSIQKDKATVYAVENNRLVQESIIGITG
jgi:hypothetical protein